MKRQTIDHESDDFSASAASAVPAVIRPLGEILDSYRNRDRHDLAILLASISADARALTAKCRAGKFDEVQGIAKRAVKVARKIEEIAEYIAQDS